MVTFYLVCAVVGGSVLLVQLALTLLGFGGDHDIEAGSHFEISGDHVTVGDAHMEVDHADHGAHGAHDASWYFSILSFRAIVAAVAFFGVAGMAGLTSGMSDLASLIVALMSGTVAMFVVGWLMNVLGSLDSSGNVSIAAAVGKSGTVYLSIPGAYIDSGKVSVSVQGRSVEFLAKTAGGSIPTGALVTVTRVLSPGTVEVTLSDSGVATAD